MTTATHHSAQTAHQATAQQFTAQYLPLEQVTRPNLKTAEAAFYLNRAPQTLRAWACLENGPIRPRRVGGLLAWNTNEVRALAGLPSLQMGFSTLAYLACIIGAALLIQVILMVFPGAFTSLDWAGSAVMGAGVLGSRDGAPASDQASGVAGEQLSFLPTPAFCPILPPRGSAAEQALHDLLARDLTQIDWLESGNGWRLAAAVKELDYLGWEPISIRVKCNGWGRKIARYSLPTKAKQSAVAMRQGGDHA